MYTDPEIVTSPELKRRSYIKTYINGELCRIYNGKLFTVSINPNRAKSLQERNRLLRELLFEVKKHLQLGWTPEEAERQKTASTQHAMMFAVSLKKSDPTLSKSYKTDLESVWQHFYQFLSSKECNQDIRSLKPERVEAFLEQFNSSATYYMNRRRNLGVLFNELVRRRILDENPIKPTTRRKVVSRLHKIYQPVQVPRLLERLREINPNLGLLCLITYGCFLRPHEEVRLLNRSHFNADLTRITLSGSENKSRKIRAVTVPDYVRSVLLELKIDGLRPDQNIFTRSVLPFNKCYFSLVWARCKKELRRANLLENDQTIYSFRHTAAVNIYERTKDPFLIQKLMGHSSLSVTLKYLRGLGVNVDQQLDGVTPTLGGKIIASHKSDQ